MKKLILTAAALGVVAIAQAKPRGTCPLATA